MIHKNGSITKSSARAGKATTAISNRATTFAISGHQTKWVRLMGWEYSIIVKMMATMSSRSLGINIIVGSRVIVVKLMEYLEMSILNSCSTSNRGRII
jgi:hypothetical protein